MRPFTLVSLHAHPDDETLLTGGTLARAAAEGHRAVVVCATGGERGLAAGGYGTGAELAAIRQRELREAAALLGCQQVAILEFADSGDDPAAVPEGAFSRLPVDDTARAVAAVLLEERADVLTVYDAAGGYGHPDHIAVHRVGLRAAELAGTPVVLQATVDRGALLRAARLVHRLPGIPAGFGPRRLATAYTPSEAITHVVDVRRQCGAKRAAMRAHASQATGGADRRTLAVLAGLPLPVFRTVLGREWFVEVGRQPGRCGDVFASLR